VHQRSRCAAGPDASYLRADATSDGILSSFFQAGRVRSCRVFKSPSGFWSAHIQRGPKIPQIRKAAVGYRSCWLLRKGGFAHVQICGYDRATNSPGSVWPAEPLYSAPHVRTADRPSLNYKLHVHQIWLRSRRDVRFKCGCQRTRPVWK